MPPRAYTLALLLLSLPTALFSLLPLARLTTFATRTIRRRSRETRNLCPHCGYDLRHSPTRCPECGATPT